jgi:subtilase family serine protease
MRLVYRWFGVVAVALAWAAVATSAIGTEDVSLSSAQLRDGSIVLSQTVPPWVKRAKEIAPADNSKRVLITAYLSWRNQGELEQLLRDLTTPGNPGYGQFLTPAQFHAAFSPRPEDVNAVQSGLRSLGFKIEYTPDSGLFVRASGTVAEIKQVFHVSQNLYSYRGKVLRAHAEEPSLAPPLAGLVTYIAGLDDSHMLMRPTSMTRFQGPARVNSGSIQLPFGFAVPSPCSNYWGDTRAVLQGSPFPYGLDLPYLPCGYTPQQIREGYGANKVDKTGWGVRVAITDLYASPTLVSDVNRYSANHGLPALTPENFEEILPPGVNSIPKGDPCASASWLSEQTLDVTAVHTMAPGASIVYVGGVCDPVDEVDGGVAVEPIYQVIDQRLADIVSDSWLYNGEADVAPAQLLSDNAEFIQAAIEGMTLLFASGDDGDLLQQGGCFGGPRGVASGSWPSTSPFVTSIGGTSLLIMNASGEKAEYGWGSHDTVFQSALISEGGKKVTEQGYSKPFSWVCGSGGGPSLVMPEPFYQSTVVPPILATQTLSATGQVVHISPPARVTPDISMLADFNEGLLVGETYDIFSPQAGPDPGCTQLTETTEYCEQPTGGTSLATPLFAGVLALVNEKRFSTVGWPLGFVNPALYRLRVGKEWFDDKPIIDVNAPTGPIGGLIAVLGTSNAVGFGAIDSNVDADGNLTENVDSSLRSVPGYDDVTGLGVPNVPALIRVLGRFP